jgi:tetratricopeptide (TPR) repeat protein
MEIRPEVSGLTGEYVQVGTINLPITTTKYAETKVTIKDGQTIVIGGLISEDNTKISKKVPLLGSIPIVGNVFKHTSEDKTNRELLIFVTPHIVDVQKEFEKEKKKEKIQSLYEKGKKLIDRGQLREAEDIYNQILGLSSEEKDAKEFLSRIEEKLKQEKAEKELKEKKHMADKLVIKAKKYISNGEYEKALEEISEALKYVPDYKQALKYRKEVEGKISERETFINKLFDEGLKLYKQEKYYEANQKFLKILDVEPKNERAEKYHKLLQERLKELARKEKERQKQNFIINTILKKADIFYKQKNYEEAIKAYKEVLEIEPQNRQAKTMIDKCKREIKRKIQKEENSKYRLGLKYYRESKFKEALRYFEQVLKLNPKHKMALVYKNRCKEKIEEKGKVKKEKTEKAKEEEATEELNLIGKEVKEELKPTSKGIIDEKFKKAKELFSHGEYSHAKGIFKEIIELQPTNEEAKLYYKICIEKSRGYEEKIRKKERGEKIEKKEKLSQITETKIEKLYKKGERYYLDGNYERAVEFFEKIIALDPQQEKALFYIESCYKEIDKRKEEFKRQKIEALLEKGRELVKQEKYDLALDSFYQVFEIEPNNKEAMKMIISLKKKLEVLKKEEARHLISEEARRQEKQLDEKFSLAQSLYKQGNYIEAKNILEDLLKQKKQDKFYVLLSKIDKKLEKKEVKPKEVRNGKKYYRQAIKEYRKKNWLLSLELFKIASIDPLYKKRTAKYIKICKKKIKEKKLKEKLAYFYKKGINYFNLALYDESMKFLKQILEINPHYKDASKYYKKAKEREEILKKIGEYEQILTNGDDPKSKNIYRESTPNNGYEQTMN